mgnify:CR=1 FL=1
MLRTSSAFGRSTAGAEAPVRDARSAPRASRSNYVGDYLNDLYGPIGVVDAAEGLSLTLGPKPTPYPLRHYSGDIFTFQPPGENASGVSPVRFSRSGDKATSVVIDYFNGNGQGVFLRK